jgi:hypothetical protein
MSAYAVPTNADACMTQFVSILNARVSNQTTYSLFMPLITELMTQSSGRINMTPINRLIGELPTSAQTAGAEALSYLRRFWGPGLSAPAPAPRRVVAATTQAAQTVRPTPSPAPPVVTPRPSSPVATPAPAPSPVVSSPASSSASVTVERALIRDAAETAGGTVSFSWTQSSLFDSLGIPRDTFNGFCAMAVGEFLARPTTVRTKLTTQKGKVDLINAHGRYRGSGRTSYDFITGEFGLTYVNATSLSALTAENAFRAVETHSGAKKMIGITKTTGGGHAVGLIIASGRYTFFDAEEGQAELGDRNAFWLFLRRYIDHPTKGLKTDYQNVFVATWS